ncbi:MAG: hypothetical protein D6740_11220 [Alphaproteobacteria bacterium]|nr:MAG: hypothetical protein D6740_11220 [Alphaproteobacteria bacterium]
MMTTVQVGAVAYAVTARTGGRLIRRHLAHCYGDYPPAEGHVDHWISLHAPTFWRRLIRPNLVSDVPAPVPLVPLPARLAPVALESAMNLATAGENDRFVMFHAATIAHGEDALVLPGASGAGKSTLAAAAMLSGWTLLSDEYAAFEPCGERRLVAVPRAVSLKNESIAYLGERFALADRLGHRYPGTPKGTIAFLPARPIAPAARFRPRAVVFPVRRPGSDPHLRPLDPIETTTRLLEAAMNFATQGEPALAILRDLVTTIPAYALRYGEATAALGLLEDLLRGRGEGGR